MEPPQVVTLFITHVEKEGPFLKVWGQSDKNTSAFIETFLKSLHPQFDQGLGQTQQSLSEGKFVCAKYKDNEYYRARITSVSNIHEGLVEVLFMDYGNKDFVPFVNIRHCDNLSQTFISVPPLASGFIFAEGHCPGGGDWNEPIFETITKELRYTEVQCRILTQATQYYLVKFYLEGNDLCPLFISRGLLQPISLQAQQAVLLSMSMQRHTRPIQAPSAEMNTLNTYKAMTLEAGKTYPVYVSYVNDGPCHFSVQLKQSEDVIVKLMNDINSIGLSLLDDVPIPGTICLAKCQEDGNICRAVITNEVDNKFKVFYVDFGNYEVVPLDNLYQIPFKYVIPKVMAIRYALAGIEKPSITLEMSRAFKKFVDNRLLHMKVLPGARISIPKCELWDPETKTSALDVLNRAAKNSYPEPLALHRGFNQTVTVSFVFSCNRFYVQLSSKEDELLKLMLDLQVSCASKPQIDLSNIKVGLPCSTLFEVDQQWYRSEVVEVYQDGSVKVRYIDFGNEDVVQSANIKLVDGEQLTVLRPQAIECCLNGYQNMGVDIERDTLFEELILEKKFVMKVADMLGTKALVELIDETNYNVASLLLDKLAAANSQVSPMLVQANHRVEHRKSAAPPPPQFGGRDGDRKPNRDRNENKGSWNDRANGESWRKEDGPKDYRNRDKNSNENNTEDTWRKNNKGFSNSPPKENRYNRENKKNDFQNNKIRNDTNNDSWNLSNANTNDDWNTPKTESSGYKSREKNDYGNRPNDKGNRNNRDSKPGDRGDYKKKDFRREGSEISSSGSEKSFHKGPRTSSRNGPRKYDNPRYNASTENSVVDDSWNVSAVTIDAAPNNAKFLKPEVVGTTAKVAISWFHTPEHFYCQLSNSQVTFKQLMEEIQTFYKTCKQKLTSVKVGQPLIALFPEDKVLYRAQTLQVQGNRYKVYYVDFGNVSVVDQVWPIENKFMTIPAQAICCGINGVTAEKWEVPDRYSKYFDKEEFDCTFVSKDEKKTFVELSHNNVNIGQQMIQDGLAAPATSASAAPALDLTILLGQQFRVQLEAVNSLEDIDVVIQIYGLPLKCKMHNLATAVEKYEDLLKERLQQSVIVYVDNVIGNFLEVTFYDSEGNKLPIIDPDEGAFDTVEPICPILILSGSLHGFVSHVEPEGVFVQPSEYADTVAYLLEQLYEHYSSEQEKTETDDSVIIPEEGFVYAVCSPADGNWYRGRVETFDDASATVCYVDYGNSEQVPFAALKSLDPKFMEFCTLCVRIGVKTPTDTLADKEVIANIAFGEIGWDGEVLEKPTTTEVLDQPVTQVQQRSSGESAYSEATLQSTETPVLGQSTTLLEDAVKSYGTPVVITHTDSPTDFYVQLFSSVQEIEELQAMLQEQAEAMSVLDNISVGVLCAAPYSADQNWYRAQVLDADDDITTVRFVDFGNTDVIDNKTTQIKTLPQNLLSLEVYVTRCTLKLAPMDEEWSAAATERFEELSYAEQTSCIFLEQDEKTNFVELYANGQNVRDILITENLAKEQQNVLESKSTGFISHINSPSEFWIQLENCADELESIAEQLSGAEKFPELEDFTPGTLCVALFPDDEMWYRARILSNTVGGIELLFIDYGNSTISCSLRQIPEELVVTPPLAQKCSLIRPDCITYWTPEAIAKFNEISADGQTIFTVKKITTGETATVELLVEGQDVVELLRPITQNGFVKNVQGLSEFDLERDGLIGEKQKLECLPGMGWTDESQKRFGEIVNEGKTLFEIEQLADNTVRLYLNKKDIRPDLSPEKAVHSPNTSEETVVPETSSETTLEAKEEEVILAVGEIQPEEVKEVETRVETEVLEEALQPEEVLEPVTAVEAKITKDDEVIAEISKEEEAVESLAVVEAKIAKEDKNKISVEDDAEESGTDIEAKITKEDAIVADISKEEPLVAIEAQITKDKEPVVDISKEEEPLANQVKKEDEILESEPVAENQKEEKIVPQQIESKAIEENQKEKDIIPHGEPVKDGEHVKPADDGPDSVPEGYSTIPSVDVEDLQPVHEAFQKTDNVEGESNGKLGEPSFDIEELQLVHEMSEKNDIVKVEEFGFVEEKIDDVEGENNGKVEEQSLDIEELQPVHDASEKNVVKAENFGLVEEPLERVEFENVVIKQEIIDLEDEEYVDPNEEIYKTELIYVLEEPDDSLEINDENADIELMMKLKGKKRSIDSLEAIEEEEDNIETFEEEDFSNGDHSGNLVSIKEEDDSHDEESGFKTEEEEEEVNRNLFGIIHKNETFEEDSLEENEETRLDVMDNMDDRAVLEEIINHSKVLDSLDDSELLEESVLSLNDSTSTVQSQDDEENTETVVLKKVTIDDRTSEPEVILEKVTCDGKTDDTRFKSKLLPELEQIEISSKVISFGGKSKLLEKNTCEETKGIEDTCTKDEPVLEHEQLETASGDDNPENAEIEGKENITHTKNQPVPELEQIIISSKAVSFANKNSKQEKRVVCEETEKVQGTCAEDELVSELEQLYRDFKKKSKIEVSISLEQTFERPQSSSSGKISHDDKILPAVVSRPQTPLTPSDED